jgi:type II secretory pathway pseudopilin PulG
MRFGIFNIMAISISRCRQASAFTLVEMLAVTAIITILLGLIVPAVHAITKGAGRRAAIHQLITTFDQARVAAIKSACSVYIGFADSTFPNVDMRHRSFILFRPRSKDDTPSVDTRGASNYVYLTSWKKLPEGIAIKSENNSIVGAKGASIPIAPADRFPNLRAGRLPVVEFNSTGGVSQPVDSKALQLFIYEGFFQNGRDVIAQADRDISDVISIARFTGRPRAEVASISK